jgi:malonate decarboxylase epsilon subunit
MLVRLPSAPIVRETLRTAEDVLRMPVRDLDTASALTRTENVQVALLISGVATARMLIEAEVQPQFVAGHSVGTFAAAVIAGVLPFERALQLVVQRSKAMVRAAPRDSGMAVLAGAPLVTLEHLVSEADVPEGSIYIANRNAPDQIVVGGKNSTIEQLLRDCRAFGLRRAQMLAVRVPSHTPWMLPVAKRLLPLASRIRSSEPVVPCGSNISGRLLYESAEIIQDIVWGVARPVNWIDCMSALYEAGTQVFLEMPPGAVLTSIARSRFPDIRAYSVEQMSIAAVLKVVGLHPKMNG